MKNRIATRVIAWFVMILLSAQLLQLSVSADVSFIDNEHWSETTSDDIWSRFEAGESFVVMFFSETCFNSNLRKVLLDELMTNYDFELYGVNSSLIPRFIFDELKSGAAMPIIAIVEDGKVDCFSANDSMRSIQNRLQTYCGIYDESAIDFSALDAETFSMYSTHTSTVESLYLTPPSDIPEQIRAEAESAIQGAISEKEKAKAIYDWVTKNIYYNYGMLNGTVPLKTSAQDTYRYKNSVCSGYANLTAAMCNAVGIPCRVVTGFATGVGAETTNVWNVYKAYLETHDLNAFVNSMNAFENHAWNEAFVDGKWMIMDTTWGSNNDLYPNSGRIIGTPTDKYFDPDLEWFSESHLFWGDYSSDLLISTKNGITKATGTLELNDTASANCLLIALFDSNGKLLECIQSPLNGGNVSLDITNQHHVDRIKVFLIGDRCEPTARPYLGRMSHSAARGAWR